MGETIRTALTLFLNKAQLKTFFFKNIPIYLRRGGNKIIFTLARLASESNFALASEYLHSPEGENMKNENHLNVGSLI